MVILESVKFAHTCVSNVLSSVLANDSFTENLREEREAFVAMLVAVLQSWKTMHECVKVVMEKIAKLFPTKLPD